MPAEWKLSPDDGTRSPASSAPSLRPRGVEDLGAERPRQPGRARWIAGFDRPQGPIEEETGIKSTMLGPRPTRLRVTVPDR